MKYLGAASFFFFLGCASPSPQGACNPQHDICDFGVGGGGGSEDLAASEDLSPAHDLSVPPDLTPLKKFGDPCMSPNECESGFCVFSGLSGVCSQLCNPPDCPMGYGCYNVLGGGIDPGQVSNICVPENNVICSPCSLSSECSTAGKDLCMPGPLGGNFCARDCTNVSCPGGYSCNAINIQGLTVHQCQPTAGSCDCHLAGQANTKIACDITTPFGTCAGSHTCGGVAGWGSCLPPSMTDVPDQNFADENCDGIDGDINAGIFVATTGSDVSGCGATYPSPCRTVNYGLQRSVEDSKKYVYVQAGIYNEAVGLQAGKVVVGGYDTTWKRAARTVNGHETRIKGVYDSSSGQFVAVTGTSINVATTLMDLFVQGADATIAGKSSYAVYLNNAKITLTRVTVVAGNGANGGNGYNAGGYSNANATSGMFGSSGGDASQGFSVCDSGSRGGAGGAGTNSCSGGVNPNAGSGGVGGTKDSSCCAGQCAAFCGDCSSTNGSNGNAASQTFSSYWGLPGPGSATCANGNGGNPGLVQNGPGGTAAGGRGILVASFWTALSGGSGGLGDHGSGGGGGGGSGGCDSGTDSYGAGGGGGGAGGCKSPDAGGGGLGGGGSFGVYAVSSSTVNASDCVVQRGNGGIGGTGGAGGRGQAAGGGAGGGNSAGGSKTGGAGGNGGHGGHGGAGAGGSGGISAGFFSYSSTVNQSCAISGGAVGAGGSGGSRPAASDGADGQTGNAGSLADVFTCNNPGGC